jgi:hypothetical protein
MSAALHSYIPTYALTELVINKLLPVAYPGILFGEGGVQQIHVRTEGRENGDLGAVAP